MGVGSALKSAEMTARGVGHGQVGPAGERASKRGLLALPFAQGWAHLQLQLP